MPVNATLLQLHSSEPIVAKDYPSLVKQIERKTSPSLFVLGMQKTSRRFEYEEKLLTLARASNIPSKVTENKQTLPIKGWSQTAVCPSIHVLY
jgi:hypothetical protein